MDLILILAELRKKGYQHLNNYVTWHTHEQHTCLHYLWALRKYGTPPKHSYSRVRPWRRRPLADCWRCRLHWTCRRQPPRHLQWTSSRQCTHTPRCGLLSRTGHNCRSTTIQLWRLKCIGLIRCAHCLGQLATTALCPSLNAWRCRNFARQSSRSRRWQVWRPTDTLIYFLQQTGQFSGAAMIYFHQNRSLLEENMKRCTRVLWIIKKTGPQNVGPRWPPYWI